MTPTPTAIDAEPAPTARASDFGLRAWALRPGWIQVSVLLLLAAPVVLLGAVSGGIYGATLCGIVWLALRMADEDAAWVVRDSLDQEILITLVPSPLE